MRSKTVSVNDRIAVNEIRGPRQHGLWAKTEVIWGYGEVHNDHKGKAYMDEPIGCDENTVVIGGVQYVMENLFNVKGPAKIPTLREDSGNGIGEPDSADIDISGADANFKFDTPKYNSNGGTEGAETWHESAAPMYRPGHFVQLFGVGITGAGENDVTVYPVSYREKSINISTEADASTTIKGVMYPFRFTNEALSDFDKAKYFGKKSITVSDGTDQSTATAYYLKKFEQQPEIKHVFASQNSENEATVSSTELFSSTDMTPVDTFTEMVLKISSKDLKEYFTAIGAANKTRLNTIALFSGRYVKGAESGVSDFGDFEDVRMFSKIIINMEHLSLSKDLNIIYRVYGS